MPTANKSSCHEAMAKGSRRASRAFNQSKVFLELRSIFKIITKAGSALRKIVPSPSHKQGVLFANAYYIP